MKRSWCDEITSAGASENNLFGLFRVYLESIDCGPVKAALTSPPILAMPTDDGEMVLDTDASDKSIGAVLSQIQDGEERDIAYAGRMLDKREANYCVTRKELLAIVYAFKHFRQYLLGRQFKVRTDHALLTWLRKTPEPIGQQARWLEIMEEFEFEVIHRPGVKHTNADALSRRPCNLKSCSCKHRDVSTDITTSSVNSIIVCSVETDLDVDEHWSFESIKQAQRSDESISKIIQFLVGSPDKPPWEEVAMLSHDAKCLWSMWARLRLWRGLLQRKFEVLETGKII